MPPKKDTKQTSKPKDKPSSSGGKSQKEVREDGEQEISNRDQDSIPSLCTFWVLLRSPEKLEIPLISQGSDETDTLKDFELISDLIKKLPELYLCNTNMPFDSLINFALREVYMGMHLMGPFGYRPLLIWYYAGHGLGKKKAADLKYSSTPCFQKLTMTPHEQKTYAAVNDFVKEGRKVKGGELFLHKVGFCDLYGLLKPWIAVLKTTRVKHLVIILDSCHSGIIAQELNDFKSQTDEKDPTLLSENSVTIQAACGPDERTFGGYFTPCFAYLNDPKNKKLLNDLKVEWEEMSEERRNVYRSKKLPSPMVVTTRDQSQGTTMELTPYLTVENSELKLFPNPGFFKFCSFKVFYDQQEKDLMSLNDRVLDSTSANTFIKKSKSFNVLDYKLKHSSTGPFAGTPMGLFLLEDPNNPVQFAVCAHIHFERGKTDIASVQRINLVHHKFPSAGNILYVEDAPRPEDKIPVRDLEDATSLIEACHAFVDKNEHGRWEDVSRWNMRGGETGVNGKFRIQERDAWDDSYLEYIKQFNLPTVANTDEPPN